MLTSTIQCLLTFPFLGLTLKKKKKVIKKNFKRDKNLPKIAQKSEKLRVINEHLTVPINITHLIVIDLLYWEKVFSGVVFPLECS